MQKIAEFCNGTSYKNLTEEQKASLVEEDIRIESAKQEMRRLRLSEEQDKFYNAVKNWEEEHGNKEEDYMKGYENDINKVTNEDVRVRLKTTVKFVLQLKNMLAKVGPNVGINFASTSTNKYSSSE